MLKMFSTRRAAAEALPTPANDDSKRNQQENFKVRAECRRAILALTRAYGMSKAELLEHMVAKELEAARKAGARLIFSDK